MKTRLQLKILIVSCLPIFLTVSSAETVFVVGSDSCEVTHIHSVYQKGSGVYVTKGIERVAELCAAVALPPQILELQMDYPSIALKQTDFIFEVDEPGPEVVLYRNGQMPNRYDPELGTGWVDSEVLRSIFVRNYPWIRHPQLGWLFVREGPIVGYQLSFWFFSPEEGWIWKSPSMDQYFHFNSGTWREVSLFVPLDTEFNLSFDQEVTVIGEDLKLQFTEVIEDSRCPVDVICVWEGRLVINLKVNGQDLELSIGGDSELSKVIDGYRVTLTDVVAPTRFSNRTPRDSHYVVSLLVEKKITID